MRVHVSIHDVAPPFRAEIELALEKAHEAGARPALLVVPAWHGEAKLTDDPGFCGWLRELQAGGHEVYLHGYFHSATPGGPVHEAGGAPAAPPSRGRGLAWFYAQRVVSAGEAEMSVHDAETGRALIDAGEAVLREAGLRVDGFVAPAWSMPRWVLPVLAARGVAYTEDHTRVYSPRDGRSRPSVVLNFASRSPGRLVSTVAYCRAATPLARALPARIAIHPADMRFALLRGEVDRLLGWGRGRFVDRGPALLG